MIPTRVLEARAKMLADALADFAADCPGIVDQLRLARVDGYPAGTLGGSRGTDIADPTGEAAATPDPARAALNRLDRESVQWVALARWLDETRRAYGRRRREQCDNPWCPDRAERAEGRRQCDACARFRQRHGVNRGSPTAAAVAVVAAGRDLR